MNLRMRKLFAVWLGLIAMALFVLAPTVSQLVMPARTSSVTVAMCSTVNPGASQIVDHTASLDAMAVCDYCTLQATHLVLPALPQITPAVVALVALLLLPLLRVRVIPAAIFPLARTRAPPLFPAFV